MTLSQVQGFLIACYFIPTMAVYYRMDPAWELSLALFPHCKENDQILDDSFCIIWFVGVRNFLTLAWAAHAGRNMCAIQILACIFFELFNQCAKNIAKVRNLRTAMQLYWIYWKISAGYKHWSKVGLAIGCYMGIWLMAVSTCVSIIVLPHVQPFLLVYVTFPITAITGLVVFLCLPIAVKFPTITENMILSWRFRVGINKQGFAEKVMRKELVAMQRVVPQVGIFFQLDRRGVSEIFVTYVDKTIDLIISFSVV